MCSTNMITSPFQVEYFNCCCPHYFVVDRGFEVEGTIFRKLNGNIAGKIGTDHDTVRTDGRDHPSNVFAETLGGFEIKIVADGGGDLGLGGDDTAAGVRQDNFEIWIFVGGGDAKRR